MLSLCFHHQIVCKLFHFQTDSGFYHTKVDAYLTKFLANFDQFMEVWQGLNGKVETEKVVLSVKSASNVKEFSEHLLETANKLISAKKENASLDAIIDAMVADILQLNYLLSFN